MTMVRDRTLFGKVCVKLLRNKFQGAETCVLVGVLLNFVCSTFLATNEVLFLSVQNWTVHGLYWGSYFQHKPEVLRESTQELLEMLGKGTLRVNVSHTFSLDQVGSSVLPTLGFICMLLCESVDGLLSRCQQFPECPEYVMSEHPTKLSTQLSRLELVLYEKIMSLMIEVHCIFHQANQAFATIQQRQVMGKVMILPGEKLDDMNPTTTGAISKL
jgi:hypothetical protein